MSVSLRAGARPRRTAGPRESRRYRRRTHHARARCTGRVVLRGRAAIRLDRSFTSDQNGHMASVPITELKAHLAKYLRMAQRGVEVLVLERGVAVARIVAMPHRDESQDAGIDSLVRAGIVRRGAGQIRSLLRRRLPVSTNLLGALDEDREDRA